MSIEQALNESQRARVEALRAAREVVKRTGLASSSVDVAELTGLAGWILTGTYGGAFGELAEFEEEKPARVPGTFGSIVGWAEAGTPLGAVVEVNGAKMVRLKITFSERDRARAVREEYLDTASDVPTILDVLAEAGAEVGVEVPVILVPNTLWGIRTWIQESAGLTRRVTCGSCGESSGDVALWAHGSVWAWLHADEHFADDPDRHVEWDWSPETAWRGDHGATPAVEL